VVSEREDCLQRQPVSEKAFILYAVFFYVRYAGSYPRFEEIMARNGVSKLTIRP